MQNRVCPSMSRRRVYPFRLKSLRFFWALFFALIKHRDDSSGFWICHNDPHFNPQHYPPIAWVVVVGMSLSTVSDASARRRQAHVPSTGQPMASISSAEIRRIVVLSQVFVPGGPPPPPPGVRLIICSEPSPRHNLGLINPFLKHARCRQLFRQNSGGTPWPPFFRWGCLTDRNFIYWWLPYSPPLSGEGYVWPTPLHWAICWHRVWPTFDRGRCRALSNRTTFTSWCPQAKAPSPTEGLQRKNPGFFLQRYDAWTVAGPWMVPPVPPPWSHLCFTNRVFVKQTPCLFLFGFLLVSSRGLKSRLRDFFRIVSASNFLSIKYHYHMPNTWQQSTTRK